MATAPKMPLEDVKKQLDLRSRGPFVDLLARFLSCAPTDEAIHEEAQKYPNRFVQNVQMLTRTAGYRDGIELDVSGTLVVQALSDSDLVAELVRLRSQLGELDNQSSDRSPQAVESIDVP